MEENREVTVVPSPTRRHLEEISLIACPRSFLTERIAVQRPGR